MKRMNGSVGVNDRNFIQSNTGNYDLRYFLRTATTVEPDIEDFLRNYNSTILVNGSIINGPIGTIDAGESTAVIEEEAEDLVNNEIVQIFFYVLYSTVFVLGVFGNVLVCYVVLRNKAMQTVTNIFITNLALSDILLCILAVPFTPLYTFMGGWAFGRALCHLVPFAQGCSIYISTLTLTSIAIDRYFVIIYPFHPRMKLSTCIIIIVSIWIISILATLPYGLYVKVFSLENEDDGEINTYCEEDWPSEHYRKIFGSVTTILQFVLPFFIISICYTWVSLKLNARAKAKPGTKSSKREEADRDRKKRTNRMLISMVAVFGISWLPINLVNIFSDFYARSSEWKFYTFLFFIAHSIAMSSTCYNPFLYAWLNENFRKEFKHVLPCFNPSSSSSTLMNIGKNNCKYERNTFVRGPAGSCTGGNDIEGGSGNNNDAENELILRSSFKRNIVPREPTFSRELIGLNDKKCIDILLNDDPMQTQVEIEDTTRITDMRLTETLFISSENTGTSNIDISSTDTENKSNV